MDMVRAVTEVTGKSSPGSTSAEGRSTRTQFPSSSYPAGGWGPSHTGESAADSSSRLYRPRKA